MSRHEKLHIVLDLPNLAVAEQSTIRNITSTPHQYTFDWG